MQQKFINPLTAMTFQELIQQISILHHIGNKMPIGIFM